MTRLEAYDAKFIVKQSLHEAKMELINQIYDDFETILKNKQAYGMKGEDDYWQGYADACGESLEQITDEKRNTNE